jgi:hypothetical protein
MKTLLELFQKYNNYEDVEYPSDKNSYHSYIEDVYEEYFAPYRNKKINLLEIGVSFSGSIRLWNDYFKNAQIYGADNFSCGEDHKNKSQDLISGSIKNIKIICDDAYDNNISHDLPEFDIIIDDGPHTLFTQMKCIEIYLPKLKSDGIMFIEDIIIDFDYDYERDDLAQHPSMKKLIEKIPDNKYEYKIFDLRKNVIGRQGIPEQGRGDNVILAIKPL